MELCRFHLNSNVMWNFAIWYMINSVLIARKECFVKTLRVVILMTANNLITTVRAFIHRFLHVLDFYLLLLFCIYFFIVNKTNFTYKVRFVLKNYIVNLGVYLNCYVFNTITFIA